MTKLKFFSYNCNGIGNATKRRQVFQYVRHKKPDICILQESHSIKNMEKIWKSEWGGEILFSHGLSNARGVCILFKPGLSFKVHNTKRDKEGRSLCIDLEIEEVRFTLLGLYAPNEDEPEFFKECFKTIEHFDNNSKIIAGDFNLVMDLDMDKKGGIARTHFKSRETLQLYMEEAEILDIWRQQHPNEKKYTWHRNKPPVFCRLDMILTSFDMVGYIDKSDILPSFKSDHSFVTLEMDLHKEDRGRGLWKLNTTHLFDQEYVNLINECIAESDIKYDRENPALKLELTKWEVMNCSRKYAKNKAQAKRNILETLEKRLHQLEKERDQAHNTEKETVDDILNVKREIDSIMEEKTKSAIFRSKIKWYKEGEKSSKYFFNLEKSKYNKKVMKSTFLADGSKTKDSKKILKEQSNFYSRLYTSDENVEFNVQVKNLPVLSNRDKESLDKPITLEDLAHALKNCKNNKTPGCDGLPVEFYKVFWNKIKHILHAALIYAYNEKTLHISARRGVICLIPKKHKDLNYIKNWRPLTLLNSDYKILSKVLAIRLKLCLDKLINRDQTGFMKNRFIGENIRKILDVIDYTEMEDIPAIIISIDFEKCFDRIEWSAVYKTMELFNFGNTFINWVKLLYNDIYSCTTNNGHSSEWFNPSRGLRQGCPMSPYIYLLCGEIFANLVRNSSKIKGIPLCDSEIRISQYADDTNLFSMFDKSSLDGITEIFNTIEKSMGVKVNYDKTNIYRIGSIRYSQAKLYTQKNFRWESSPINVLGVDISHSEDIVIERNYNQVLSNVRDVLNLWENRDLSLMGKVLVVNSLLASQFVYKLSALRRNVI